MGHDTAKPTYAGRMGACWAMTRPSPRPELHSGHPLRPVRKSRLRFLHVVDEPLEAPTGAPGSSMVPFVQQFSMSHPPQPQRRRTLRPEVMLPLELLHPEV